MRAFVSAAAVLMFLLGSAWAQNENPNQSQNQNQNVTPSKKAHHKGHVHHAKIVNIDPQKGTVTLQFKGKNGKTSTRTFQLTEDIEYADSTGRVANVSLFRSGDEVLVVEEKGRLKSVTQHQHQHKGNKSGQTTGRPAGAGIQK